MSWFENSGSREFPTISSILACTLHCTSGYSVIASTNVSSAETVYVQYLSKKRVIMHPDSQLKRTISVTLPLNVSLGLGLVVGHNAT